MKHLFLFAGLLVTVPIMAQADPSDDPHPQIVHVDPNSDRSIIDLAIDYAKPRQNAVAVLISDGYQDEIEGQKIAELLIKWFREDYDMYVVCFVDAPDDVQYSFVSYIVGDIPYGPWGLMDTKRRLADIAAAYDANILIRAEAEKKAEKGLP